MKIAFENELIIVNNLGEVQNYINGEIASKKVIKDLRKKYKKIMDTDCIIPELDACQLEIKNNGPKNTLSEAQDEILSLFELVQEFLEENNGLYISQNVVPNQEYSPTSSSIYERYDIIMDGLKNIGEEYAKGTNIAGLHINFDINLQTYLNLNNKLKNIFDKNDFLTLGMSKNRFEKYQKTVEGVNKALGFNLGNSFITLENIDDLREKLFDENGEVKFDYNLLRLKKISEIYVGELRSFDGGVNISDLEEKTKKAYDLILSLK